MHLFFDRHPGIFARAGHEQGASNAEGLVRERAYLPDLFPHLYNDTKSRARLLKTLNPKP